MNHLYVYYKLSRADRPRALAPAQQVLAAGRAWCSRSELLARPLADDGIATWMEVYKDVKDPAALERALSAAAADSGLAALLASPRRTEWFAALPATAADFED